MDVEVAFDARGTLSTFDPRGHHGGPPALPVPPKPFAEEYYDGMQVSLRDTIFDRSIFYDSMRHMQNISDPDIKTDEDHHTVKWLVKHLKHARSINFQPLFFAFASESDAQSFSIHWSIHAGNYPEPLAGQLHVVVSAGNLAG